MPFDYNSFIAGIQVGRRLRIWDASRYPNPVPPPADAIITEDGIEIDTEAGEVIVEE